MELFNSLYDETKDLSYEQTECLESKINELIIYIGYLNYTKLRVSSSKTN